MARRFGPAYWPWPTPALLAWLLAWLLFKGLGYVALDVRVALVLATGLGVLCSVWGDRWWRRVWIGAGFPLSLALVALSAATPLLPPWAWLLPLAVLLLVYPLNAWRDAPLFPTPLQALHDLPLHAPLPPGAPVLDAGCGAGHGLQALRAAYPQADLHGLEWSWPLRWLSALRCPWARVRRADIWQADWSGYALVYLFQRPESMTRAVLKAAELAPGAYLVSLEFEASLLRPHAQYRAPDGKMVWIYQAPFVPI